MFSQKDILSTLDMINKRHLDIRTITMGISLLDCCDTDLDRCCEKIYNKITRCAKDLVKVDARLRRDSVFPSSISVFLSPPLPLWQVPARPIPM